MCVCVYTYVYIHVRGAFNKFPDGNGERRSGISAQAARHDDDDDCYTSYEITDQFLLFQLQMNSYSLIVTVGEFLKCNLDVRKNDMQ